MASFNGLDLGAVVAMRTTAAPPAFQRIAFPGLRGIGATFQGSRGQTTEAVGLAYADDIPTLASTEQAFRDLQNNGTAAALVDTTGKSWANVILLEYRPTDDIELTTAGWARAYRMTFWHLSEA